MKQKLFYLIALCLLSLASCNQDNGFGVEEQPSDEYVTLSLELSSGGKEDEEARVFHYAGSGSQNVSIFFGKDGDKIPMRVALFKYPKGTERAIYTGVLDWTIENNGRRARYKGVLNVLRDKLVGAGNRFIIYVTPESNLTAQRSINITPIMLLPTSRSTARELSKAFMMEAPLIREGDTLKNDWENTTQPNVYHKFIPYMSFVQLSIQNNRSEDMYLSMAVLQDQGEGIVTSRNLPEFLFGTPGYTEQYTFHNERFYFLKTENNDPIRIEAKSSTKVAFLTPFYRNELLEVEFIRGTLSGTKEYIPLSQMSVPTRRTDVTGIFYPYGIALN